MSCPPGRFSISIFAVKSLSGSAAIGGSARASLNDSVVATSTSICAGRSVRAQTTPPSTVTSPDCTPWVTAGRSAARERWGIATAPSAPALVVRKRRRENLMFMKTVSISREAIAQGGRHGEADAILRQCDAAITRERLRVASGPELGTGALQVLRQAEQHRLAVGNRRMELVERNVEGGKRTFLDRAVVVAAQRVAQDLVGLGLHLIEILGRLALSCGGDHVEQPLPQMAVVVALVLFQIARKPGADRAHARERHQGPPDVIAVSVEEGLFFAVDESGGAGMHGNHRILVGVGRFDLRRQREFRHQLLAYGEQLTRERLDGGFGHSLARHN